jgi:putative membrane protein
MMNKLMYLAAFATLPIAATVAAAPVTPATYVMKAGAGDQYEIQSSKLLLQTTQNPKLRAFANMMIADHTKSTADVKAAAMKAGLHPAPPKLDAMGVRNLAALRAAKGATRDNLYVSQQKTSHQKALALHQGYASSGTSSPLKMVAGNIAPVVEKHFADLNAM